MGISNTGQSTDYVYNPVTGKFFVNYATTGKGGGLTQVEITPEQYDAAKGAGSAATLKQGADTAAIGKLIPPPAPAQPAIPTLGDLNAAIAPAPAAAPRLAPGVVTPASYGAAATARGAAPQALTPALALRPQPRPGDPIQGMANAALAGAAPLQTPSNYVAPGAQPRPGAPGSESPNEITDGPAQVDQQKINALLGNVNTANAGILGIAQNQNDLSLAQAQLASGAEAAARSALGQARSGNTRDRAMNERAAVGEGSAIAQQANRDAAVLRAQEEESNRKLRLDAYKAAGDLGLNTAGLQVDVSNLNMQAATSYLNNLFETQRTGMQIDQAKAEMLTGFLRDMTLISKDYYALNMQERQSVRDDLTRRYGFDKQMEAEVARLDAEPGFWEKAALGLVSGAGSGAVAVGAKLLTGGAL